MWCGILAFFLVAGVGLIVWSLLIISSETDRQSEDTYNKREKK